ncbi:O-acetylhomoserine aminocarboxypropyltransferase/cysteine synthase [Candidatus Bipolaricaulota bacterium]|nr:O-acetylhomoserine aminocarboxypropyltransferase/cysteine synthase [Candidatus Bipolaricaulota bacterium]
MMNDVNEKSKKFDTLAVHAGKEEVKSEVKSSAVPIHQTASYLLGDTQRAQRLFSLEEEGDVYSRISNPTNAVFEERLASLEGGVGSVATSSGMSALNLIVFTLMESGQNLVTSSSIYGGTHTYFNHSLVKYGMEARFTETDSPESFAEKIDDETRFLHLETIGNPSLDVPDIEAISEVAHEADVPLVVDNTFATPYLCKPFEHGADVVWHSTTKWLNGGGTTIGGAVVDSGEFPWESGDFPGLTEDDPSYHGVNFRERFGDAAFINNLRARGLKDLGSIQSPFDTFLNLKGLETLPLRMDKHCQNASKITEFLEGHPGVSWVNYPGLESHETHELASRYLDHGYGGVITFGIKGGYESGVEFMESVELISFLANVGDAKSLIIHPSSTTHQQLREEEKESAGISDDLLRFSVGIEDPKDIKQDLDRALRKVT